MGTAGRRPCAPCYVEGATVESLFADADADGDGGAPDVGTPQEPIPRIPENPIVFLEGEGVYMDANGEKFTTEEIQEYLDWKRKYKKIVFIIGDAYGIPEEMKKYEPNLIMSVSKFTLTHEIIPLILAEQIYRISCIYNNHPYHK